MQINNVKVVGRRMENVPTFKPTKYLNKSVTIKTELIAENCREEQKLSPIKPHI